MAYPSDIAALLRADLGDAGELREQAMFGGLCFMVAGHMLCAAHPDGALFRVGKAAQPDALALPGVTEMAMAGRVMGGFVLADGATVRQPASRARLLSMARAFHATLPAK